MIPSPNHSSRAGERVRLVVIHTSEGARTVDSLGAFLQRVRNASYHGGVDDGRYEAFVDYSRAAWHLRGGNQEADGLCLCAFAGWDRAEWLRHGRMLELTAAWIADRCRARGLPVDHLPDRAVGDVMRNDHHRGGVTDHDGYTKGTGDGTHWDVGPNFPFDIVIPRAQQLAGVTPEVDLLRDERDCLFDIRQQLTGSNVLGQYPGYDSWIPGGPKRTVTDAGRDTVKRLEDLSHGTIGLYEDLAERVDRMEGVVNAIAAKLEVQTPNP